MMKRSGTFIGLFLLLCSCSVVQRGTMSDNFSCYDYDWSEVEQMVAPYLDGVAFTSLVMQGQSANYRSAAAADHCLAFRNQLPDDVVQTLERIRNNRC